MPTLQKRIGSGFSSVSTADDVLKGVDACGKIAIVTGGYSGLGRETAPVLRSAAPRSSSRRAISPKLQQRLRDSTVSRSRRWTCLTQRRSMHSPTEFLRTANRSTSLQIGPGPWRASKAPFA